MNPEKIKFFYAFTFPLKIYICILNSIFLPFDYHTESGGEKHMVKDTFFEWKKEKFLVSQMAVRMKWSLCLLRESDASVKSE